MNAVERRRRSKLAGSHPAYPAGDVDQADRDAVVTSLPQTDTRPPVPVTEPNEEHRRAGAKARKTARDAAWGWSAAHKRLGRRTGEWSAEMARARELGTAAGVLREYIAEAAKQAGVADDQVPADVWRAAGLAPPGR